MTNLAMTAGEALRTLLERARLSARAPKPAPPPGASVVLSAAQRRLWQLQQEEPDSTAYAVTAAWRLRGELDVSRLRAAVVSVLEAHEVLRTRYSDVLGSPMPRLGGSDDAAWSEAPTNTTELAAEVNRPFDLATEPALRATLLEIEPDDHLLVLKAHQIAADSWSLGVLVADLAAAYAGRRLARPALRYTDVARWRAGGASEDLAYWRARLAGASVAAELPLDRPRRGAGAGPAATFWFTFDRSLTSAVRELAVAEDVSTFSCLLAGLAALYARCTGEEDVLLGYRVSGREASAELATVVGPLANTLLLRTTLTPGSSGRSLVHEVQQRTERDLEHAGTPLEQLAALLPTDGQPARARPYRVQLVGTDVPEVRLDLPGVAVTELPAKVTTTAVDLSLAVTGLDGGPMTAEVTYDADLFDEATIALFSAQYERLLASLVADPDDDVHPFRLA